MSGCRSMTWAATAMPVGVGHVDVGHDDVGAELVDGGYRVAAVLAGRQEIEARRAQSILVSKPRRTISSSSTIRNRYMGRV